MSHRSSQGLVSVEALLPSLGALSVNRASTPKQAPIDAGKKRKIVKGEEEGGEEEGEGEGTRLGLPPTDPGTGQPVKWMKDGEFDEGAHKRIIYAQNSRWATFYPPLPPKKLPEEYDYKNWTSWFPSNRNLKIKNPHWLRAAPDNPIWPVTENIHGSLSEARAAFLDLLQKSLKPLPQPNDKNTDHERSMLLEAIDRRTGSLLQLKKILTEDGNKDDSNELKQSRELIAEMLRQNAVFGSNNRHKLPFPPPPGWMVIYKSRSPDKMKRELEKNQGTESAGKESAGKESAGKESAGKFSDLAFVGPQYASWSKKDPDTHDYSAVLQSTSVQAWLVYLMYQNSGKTHDPGEKARRTGATESEKRVAETIVTTRKQQSARRHEKLERKKSAVAKERDRAREEVDGADAVADEEDAVKERGDALDELMGLLGNPTDDGDDAVADEDDAVKERDRAREEVDGADAVADEEDAVKERGDALDELMGLLGNPTDDGDDAVADEDDAVKERDGALEKVDGADAVADEEDAVKERGDALEEVDELMDLLENPTDDGDNAVMMRTLRAMMRRDGKDKTGFWGGVS